MRLSYKVCLQITNKSIKSRSSFLIARNYAESQRSRLLLQRFELRQIQDVLNYPQARRPRRFAERTARDAPMSPQTVRKQPSDIYDISEHIVINGIISEEISGSHTVQRIPIPVSNHGEQSS
jgi:hypothetical protein